MLEAEGPKIIEKVISISINTKDLLCSVGLSVIICFLLDVAVPGKNLDLDIFCLIYLLTVE